jgi:hypothetical protein
MLTMSFCCVGVIVGEDAALENRGRGRRVMVVVWRGCITIGYA